MSAPQDTERRRVGRIIAGSGAQHLVLIERGGDDAPALCAGDILVIGTRQAGPLSARPAALCVAAVTAMTVPAPQVDGDAEEIRIAEVDLYGTLSDTTFSRGIDRTPALGDAVCAASSEDLDALYATGAPVAALTGRTRQRASVATDEMGAGFGIIGASASGKSSSLAVLVRAMLRARTTVRPVLLDTHDEYARSFGRAARIVTPGAGFTPHWLLTFEELCWALTLCGGPLSEAERAVLAEAVPAARIRMMQRTGEGSGVPAGLDTPLPYRITDAISFLDRAMNTHGERTGGDHVRLRARLVAAGGDPRLSVVFGAASAADTLPSLLGQVFGMANGSPPMSVVQLGKLELGLGQLVCAVLSRLARMVAEGSGGQRRALMIVEEAERFAPAEAPGADGPAAAEQLSRAALADLAAAGGALGVVTARPSMVDEQVLRALPTLFVHRLPSETERDAVSQVLPEGSAASVAGASTLRPRDCIALGCGVPAPGRYTMDALPEAAVPQRALRAAPNLTGADEAATLVARWRFGEATEAAQPVVSSSSAPPPMPRLRSVPAA